MRKLLTFLTLLTLSIGVGWAETATDILTADVIGISNNGQYSSYTYTNPSTTVSYSLQCATTTEYEYIQLRSKNNNSGIVSTSSIGTIKKVVVEWASNNTGNQIDIYGKNSAYSSPSDLYNSTSQGTALGSLTSASPATTELIINGSYDYIGIRSNNGAVYLKKITITWETGGSTTTTYNVNLTQTTGGTISANPTSAAAGQTVTLTATPNSGYEFSSWTVLDGDANEVTVTNNKFTMPASDVEVEATFTEQSTTPITGTQYSLIDNETDLLAAISAGKKFVIYSPDVEAASKAYDNSILPATSTGLSYDATNKILTVANNDVETYSITASETSGAYYFMQNSDNTYFSLTTSNGTSVNHSKNNVFVYFYNDYAQLKGTKTLGTSGADARALSIETVTGGFKNYSGPGKETPTISTYKLPGLYAEVETGDLTITCDNDNIEHGSISASPSTANADATITITAYPEAGYELSTVTVTPESGDAFQATVNGNTATFTMPSSKVTVTATFTKTWNAIGTSILPTDCGGEIWVYSGTVSNGVTRAQVGDDIYFRVVTDQYNSYQLESLVITDAGNNTITYVDDPSDAGWKWQDGRYGAKFKFEMPATAVTIKATYKRGDLYILGTVNETSSWHYTDGPKLAYDGTKYSIDVYFKGASEDDKFGYFSFTTKGDANSWDELYGKRIGSKDGDQTVINSDYPEKDLDWNANAFKIPAGIYTIEVAANFSTVTITPKVVTVTLDKPAGDIETGTTVNVVSNINTLLQACKSGITGTLAYSTDDGSSYTDGSSFVVNNNMTAKGKAYYGYIEAESNSYTYTVVTHYAVTATANPAKGGTVSVSPTSALAGETVTITAAPKNGYDLTSITVNGDEIDITSTPYTFEMPAQATEVVATFTAKTLHLTINNDNSKGTVYGVPATSTVGSEISFTVTPKDGYAVNTVTYSFTPTGGTENTTTLTAPYSFNMPGYDVTINITYTEQSSGGGDATDLYHETFGDNPNSVRDWDDSYSVKSGVLDVYSGITGYTVVNAGQSKNTVGYNNTSGLAQRSQNSDASIIIGPLNVANYTDLELSYYWKAASIGATYYTNLYYATSADGTYTEVEGTGNGATTFVKRTYNLPQAAQVSTLYLKIVFRTSNSSAVIDEVNLAGVPVGIQDPIFTPTPGTYGIDVDVTISCPTSGATIYYTDDESDPKTSDTRKEYTGEIVVSESTTFKAYAEMGDFSSDVVTATYTINKNTEIETVQLDYLETFTGADGIGKFSIINESGYSHVWSLDGDYGVKGTAYNPNTTPTNNAATSRLVSPIIDLTAANLPELTFSHQINSYFTNPSAQCQVFIRETTDGTSGTWVQLPVTVTVPASGSWSNDFARIDLSNYIDKKIQVSFLYTNPEAGSGAGTWEIQNFKVTDNTDVIVVNNIAEFMDDEKVEQGDVAKFRNPVVVLYHYQQYYNDEHGDYENDYIWIKDDSGYAIIYGHYLDVEYVNGDVIPAGFTATKNYYSTGKFYQLYEPEGLQPATEKALADPEPVTLAKLNANKAAYNGHYVTISKMQIQFNKGELVAWSTSSSGQRDFSVGDETLAIGNNQAGTNGAIKGYNNFDNPWLETLNYPEYENTTTVYGDFNITAIFEQYNGTWEFMPIIITPWEAQKVTLHDLCEKSVDPEGNNVYTISNNLMCVYAKGNSIWVKDDTGQSIWMTSPEDGDKNFEVYTEDAEGIPANTRLNQAYYDQSNWCEIKLADGINASTFKDKIIKGGSITGTYTDDVNPTLENVTLTEDDIYAEGSYALNYYMPANFYGPQACANPSHSTDYEHNYFYMNPKPQEYAQIVWAVWNASSTSMIMSTDDNKNGHRFQGDFEISFDMNTGSSSYSDLTNGATYNFTAILRKVSGSGSDSKAEGDSYMVYPLDLDGENPATGINTVNVAGNGEVKSVKYVNVAGMVSDTPFQGVNIVVTEYTDGTRTATKMLRK